MARFCICRLMMCMARMPLAGWVLLFIGASALVTAFIAEHVFGIAPCLLCLWDRVPYAVVFVLACVSLIAERRQLKRLSYAALVLVFVTFLSGVGLSAFHTGVERLWWGGTSGCTIQPMPQTSDADSIEKIREQMLLMPRRSCDEINWELFGLTLVNYNLISSIGFAFYAALILFLYKNPHASLGKTCCCASLLCKKKDDNA